MPLPRLVQLKQSVDQALDVFKQIIEFKTDVPNPRVARDNLIARARDGYDTWYEVIAPTVSYALRTGADFSLLQERAAEVMNQIVDFAHQKQDAMDKVLKEAGIALNSIRQAAAEAGVSQQAMYFMQEAEGHKKAATKWLVATAFLGLTALGFAVYVLYFLEYGQSQINSQQSLHLGLAKVAVFSVLSFGVLWCGRSYKSHRHNFVVNKHRQNALSTFDAFVSATKDEQTKQTVLVEAARCVFAPQQSGYLGKQSMPPTGPGQVLEVLRTTAED
jgi:hypothetical protein